MVGRSLIYVFEEFDADLHGSCSLCAASYDVHIELRKGKQKLSEKDTRSFQKHGNHYTVCVGRCINAGSYL